MRTQTSAAARAVIAVSGKGWTVYNDRLKDGRRSLKVVGWKKEQYEMAKTILELVSGCKVKLIDVNKTDFRGDYRLIRLHVTEPK